jgi:hypothetical protein
MARSPKPPPQALRLSTYAELEAYVRAFAAGHLHLLLLFGPPGVGKSRAVRQALDGNVRWISGQATPLGIYLEAYEHRHLPLVLDDIDGLYADRSGIRLLKALCQTEPVKTLGWHTLTSFLELRDVPTQFTTTSRLALIGNDWKSINADVTALEDRGHVLFFEPTALEVHCRAAGWFWDQAVFDFVAGQLHLIVQHSLRTYGQAWELKRAGLDWKRAVLSRCLSGPALVVARLLADPSFPSEAARVQAFIAAGCGCRATFYHYARKLRSPADVPKIVLTSKPPPAADMPTSDLLNDLRRRYGRLGNG